jgi:hypothetical protein
MTRRLWEKFVYRWPGTVSSLLGALTVLLVTGATPAAAAEQSLWDSGVDATTKARFIPVELWTGAEWDGKKELKMSSAETRFGDRLNKDIKGPMEWKRGWAGSTILEPNWV